MTKILVVDDEPTQSRGLLRALLLRRPDFSVLTAGSGNEAINVLQQQHVDLVITDLQMADMNGFDFLAWLFSNRPQVLAFAMTAYAAEDTSQRLETLGAVECFSKPLDIDALSARIADGLAQRIRGQVHNVGLASFLQLVELERKTCTLEVRSEGQLGKLFVRRGELLDAHTSSQVGEAAAVAILAWTNVSITIDSSCSIAERAIEKPSYYVVMEAMRIRDESVRPHASSSESPGLLKKLGSSCPPRGSDFSGLFGAPDQPPASARAARLSPEVLESLHVPVGALALAVFEAGSVLVVRSQPELKLAELVQGAASVLHQERAMLGLAIGDARALQEIFMLTSSFGELIRPLPAEDAFVLLVFDAAETNLVMARLELELFVAEYCAA
jgi:CheY-like chemotaxis protein